MVEARSATEATSLPSWVPDYTERWYNPYHSRRFTSKSDTVLYAQWISGSNILHVEARIRDEILVVSPDTRSIGANMNETVLSWLSLAAEATGSDAWEWLLHAVDTSYPISRSFDSFWRTLIGNKSGRMDGDGRMINATEDYLYIVLGRLMPFIMKKDEAKINSVVDAWDCSPDAKKSTSTPWKTANPNCSKNCSLAASCTTLSSLPKQEEWVLVLRPSKQTTKSLHLMEVTRYTLYA